MNVIQGKFKHIRTLWEYTTAKRVLFGVAGQLNVKFICIPSSTPENSPCTQTIPKNYVMIGFVSLHREQWQWNKKNDINMQKRPTCPQIRAHTKQMHAKNSEKKEEEEKINVKINLWKVSAKMHSLRLYP